MPRPRSWNASVWRALPINSMEADLRKACSIPAGLPQYEADWWFGKARTADCSGPIGEQMTRWGPNYEWLRDACIVHDMCYTSTMTKQACDFIFVTNIQALCAAPGFSDWLTSPACKMMHDGITATFEHPKYHSSYNDDQAELRRKLN